MKNIHKNLERDILTWTYQLGELGPIHGSPSPAIVTLVGKYQNGEYGEKRKVDQQIATCIEYLREKRYLYPYFNSQGEEAKSPPWARGITPKGVERLEKLQHPRTHWIGENWFPLTVAIITASIGIASITVNIMTN